MCRLCASFLVGVVCAFVCCAGVDGCVICRVSFLNLLQGVYEFLISGALPYFLAGYLGGSGRLFCLLRNRS